MSRTPWTIIAIVGSATLFVANCVLAADWPQWRGPERNGVSRETGLLKEWPKEGPKLLWQVKDIGSGYSTPAVAGERLYLVSNQGLDNEFVQALEVQGGKQVWSQRIGKVGNPEQQPDYTGARSTPTLDGELLYALGSDGDLACLETATGKVRWQKNVRTAFGGEPGTWAYAESPLVDGDVVVCAPGGKEVSLVALNKKTGEVIWKAPALGGSEAAYASTIAVKAGSIRQYVQFLKQGVVGVDAKTGNLLWRYDKTADGFAGMNMQTPVASNDLIYSAARIGGGLVRLKADKEAVAAEQVYLERNLPNTIGGAVQVGGYLYGTTDEGLVCAEFATGTVKWEDKSIGTGAVCVADGCLYIHGQNGAMALVEAIPEAYREKGRFTPPDQPKHVRGFLEKAWASPVVANGRLYIHDLGTLWCYDVKDAKAAQPEKKTAWAIVIHGGAGGAPAENKRQPQEDALRAYLNMGREMLAGGSTALDACEKVVRAFEADGRFNAGKGAVFTAEGKHSLDACIMDGSSLKVGAVAGVRTVKHPIALARLVMEKTKHVLLIRDGAEEFAQKMGLDIVPNGYFDSPGRKKDAKEAETEGGGTVGCVCLDQHGNLAAATSTGGIGGVMAGRVGDTPICGAGTYANNQTCAVSGTGTGEQFIRHNVAHTISALMQYKGMTAQQAAEEVVFNILQKGNGGVIVVSRSGEIAMHYNTGGMWRGCADAAGRFEYGVGKETKKEKVK